MYQKKFYKWLLEPFYIKTFLPFLENNGFILYGGGKNDAPDTPDYKAAAEATAAGNLDAARVNAKANRVSQYTPYGNLIYTSGSGAPTFDQSGYDKAYAQYQKELAAWNAAPQSSPYMGIGNTQRTGSTGIGGIASNQREGLNSARPAAPDRNAFYLRNGDPDRWTSTVTLSPAQQRLLDKQNEISLGLGNSMTKSLGYVNDQLATPFDESKIPVNSITPDVAGKEDVVAALMERQRPQFEQARSKQEADLMARGFNPGTSGWNARFDDLGRNENDARLAAILAGGQEQSRLFGLGQQARQQALQEQSFLRNEPLNTLNAVRTGAQVTNPTFQATPQQAFAPGADYLGAAQQGYQANLNASNAQNAAKGNMFGGLAGIGGSVLSGGSAPWWMGA